MTTPRAPFKTRRWTKAEDDALRLLVEAGRDARMIGRELNRSFMGVQARVKKLKLTIVVEKRKNFSPGNLWRWGVKANASSESKEMNRLRRFYEKVPYGQTSSRVAYVTSRAALPEATPDAEWTEDTAFNAGDAVLANPQLKQVYKEAILKGCAFEKAKT